MKNRLARNFCLIGLLALANNGMLCAQTNTTVVVVNATNAAVKVSMPAATNTTQVVLPPKPRPLTLISSESWDFDMNNHKVIYRGHVRVDDPAMKLTCEWLTADLPDSGERMTNIVAETNVVIDFTDDKGQTMHATGEEAVYAYDVQNGVTNETVTLTGQPELDNAQGKSTGDLIVWNRTSNHLYISNPKMVFRQNLNGAATGTNSPSATNPPATAPR
ncbi:MAG: LptA/OstA family protein [Verrucomicrobiota bacterium]|jgi:lipopolysaccharide transport protein LptA